MRVAGGPVICFRAGFASVAMDESHLRAAVSYVSLNPVRARLVSGAEEWAWSSVRAHLAGEDDGLVSVRPVHDRWPNFRDLLLQDYDEAFTSLRKAEGNGDPGRRAPEIAAIGKLSPHYPSAALTGRTHDSCNAAKDQRRVWT